MRSGMIMAWMALLAGTGAALAQTPSPSAPAQASQFTVPGDPAISAGPADYNGGGGDFEFPNGCPPYLFWLRPEYLLWHIPNANMPPIQTIVPFSVSGIPNFQNSFGLGNASIDYGARNGYRMTAGCWFDRDMTIGFEANFFQFQDRARTFTGAETANMPANFDTTVVVTTGLVSTNTLQRATVPFQLNTSATLTAEPAEFWGYGADFRTRKAYIGSFCFDLFGGFREITFREELSLQENIQLIVGNPIPFTVPPDVTPPLPTGVSTTANIAQITTRDLISTRNEFYGAEAGISWEWWVVPSLCVSGWGKAAVGGTFEKIFIDGNTTTSSFGVVTFQGPPNPVTGILPPPVIVANPLVSRNITQGGILTPGVGPILDKATRLAWVPEGNLTVGYLPACWVRLFCGYNWMFISNVVRPGDQIGYTTSNANLTLVGNSQNVTVVQPGYRYTTNNLFVHGLSAGVEFRY